MKNIKIKIDHSEKEQHPEGCFPILAQQEKTHTQSATVVVTQAAGVRPGSGVILQWCKNVAQAVEKQAGFLAAVQFEQTARRHRLQLRLQLHLQLQVTSGKFGD